MQTPPLSAPHQRRLWSIRCLTAFRAAAFWLSLACQASGVRLHDRGSDDTLKAEAESIFDALETTWAQGADGKGSSLWMDWGLQGVENGTCRGYERYRRKIASENDACAPSTELEATPRMIHHIWANRANPALPPAARRTLAAWKQHFPEGAWDYFLWNAEGIRALIRDHYPWFLSIFDGYPFDIQRVDAARYFMLYHYGGLYADLDFEPRTNFWDSIPKYKPGLVESPYTMYEVLQNSLMSSPRGHPFWNTVFSTMRQNRHAGTLHSTADKMLQTALTTYTSAARRTQHTGVHSAKCGSVELLPCFLFQRLTLAEDNAQNRSATERLFYAVSQLWKPISAIKCGLDTRTACQLSVHSVHWSYLEKTGLKEMLRLP